MTNREWLTTLNDYDFSRTVMAKSYEIHREETKNWGNYSAFEIVDTSIALFGAWLQEEHEETIKSEVK